MDTIRIAQNGGLLPRARVKRTVSLLLIPLAAHSCPRVPVCGWSWIAIPLRRHDMRVRVCNWITARYRVTCVLVGWWITTASHGVKRDVGHVSGGLWRVSSEHGCLLLRVE